MSDMLIPLDFLSVAFFECDANAELHYVYVVIVVCIVVKQFIVHVVHLIAFCALLVQRFRLCIVLNLHCIFPAYITEIW